MGLMESGKGNKVKKKGKTIFTSIQSIFCPLSHSDRLHFKCFTLTLLKGKYQRDFPLFHHSPQKLTFEEVHILCPAPASADMPTSPHHILTKTWVPEDLQTHVSFTHHTTSFLFRHLKDLKPWPLTWNIKFDRKTHDPLRYLPLKFVKDGHRGEGGEEGNRVEMEWELWVRNPSGFETVTSGWMRRVLWAGCMNMLTIWRSRQNCLSTVSMATIQGPTGVLVEVFCFSRVRD